MSRLARETFKYWPIWQGVRCEGILVAVEEAFNHCPKAFVRAKLWDATARPSGAPTHGDFAAARDGKDAAYARDYNAKYAERLKTGVDLALMLDTGVGPLVLSRSAWTRVLAALAVQTDPAAMPAEMSGTLNIATWPTPSSRKPGRCSNALRAFSGTCYPICLRAGSMAATRQMVGSRAT